MLSRGCGKVWSNVGVKVKYWKGAWWVFISHQGRRKAKRVGDKETALRVASRIRERLVAGDLRLGADDESETLEAHARAWLKGLPGNLKASTVAFYSANLDRYVLPLLGGRRLADVSRADCRELIAVSRSKGLKLNTVKGIARTLSAPVVASRRGREAAGQSGTPPGAVPAAGRRAEAADSAAHPRRSGASG